MRAQGLFSVAAMWVIACGGTVSPEAEDSGTTSGGEDGSGGGTSAVGMGSGTAGSSGGGSSAGPPMAGPSGGGPIFGYADASALPTMPVDAAFVVVPHDAAVVRCNNGAGPGGGGGAGGGGSGGPGSCSGFAQETCSGVSYSAFCACPQGTCACQGASSYFVAFAGCPVCPTSPEQMLAACGFPQ